MIGALHAAALAAALCLQAPPAGGSAVEEALRYAEDALRRGKAAEALGHVDRALERDEKSLAAWGLRARCAEALGEADLRAHALHQELRLAVAQKRPASELAGLREGLVAADPMARDLFDLSRIFVPRLRAVAEQYVQDGRPHSAIRAHKEVLALDPESQSSLDAIQAIASAPDPSLAGDAKPKDLLAGVSAEWIRERDAKHATWEDRDKVTREHYVTMTDSGYENLVRAAEAMEQMNAFYREFFRYGVEGDGHAVPRIELRIFKDRDEYLKKGSSPPEWSGGQFTGDAVETYVGEGGFAGMVGTLFHECAHQFVSLATTATGWLNEGLASFFEGTRILSNGTVIMNLPANHRLMPMVARLEKGWMADEKDGIDPDAPSKSEPPKAPTFRIVLENRYEWGPPWYAPTWAVVYFLYNYQDRVDGRFVYRAAFREFVDSSGGRVGEGAVENFQEVVLAHPAPPIPGFKRPKGAPDIPLPKTVEELDVVWKDWLVALAKEQNGEIEVERPYLAWARAAVLAKDDAAAREHFEKALAVSADVETLLAYAGFLAERKGADRATKLALEALRILESKEPVDEKAIAAAERSLDAWDPERKTLARLHEDLWAAAERVVLGYRAAGMPAMVLDLSWRLGSDLGVPGMAELYESALREGGRPVRFWQLAYDEATLDGWSAGPDAGYKADGRDLLAGFMPFDEKAFDYRVLTLDALTSGDWSIEADVLARRGEVNFCGLVFGSKDPRNFHGLILFPGRTEASGSREGLADTGFVDLASCFGDASFKTWRHVPVDTATEAPAEGKTGIAERWHTLRIDVADRFVDAWFDGEYLTTQEFQSADPLRGSLGLIVGPGKAKFRNVRFLARPPGDLSARYERAVRLEELEASAGAAPPGGSFLGRVPPFPKVARWIQGPRKDWKDVVFAPQLLVLWSIDQNGLVPIDGWLRDLAAAQARVGLQIVSVASANDADALEAYLLDHPLPGSVAVDAREKPGLGETFEQYSIARFNLPRILLLDVDGKVVWEGDPGFTRGAAWAAGGETFLDGPLAELIAKQKLEALASWGARWLETGLPALEKGDLATALPILQEARTLPEGRSASVEEAKKKLGAVEIALGGLREATADLVAAGADPALPVLLDYGKLLKRNVDKATHIAIAKVREAKPTRDWTEVLKRCEPIAKSVKDERKLALARELVEKLPTCEGRFPKELLADLAPAVEAGEVERVVALATGAADRPRLWLVAEYLRW